MKSCVSTKYRRLVQFKRRALEVTICVTCGACGSAGSTGDVSNETRPLSFEQFKALLPHDGPTGAYLVDGDILVRSDERLRRFYEQYFEQKSAERGERIGKGSQALTLTGANYVIPADDRRNQTYCVSADFDDGGAGRHDTVVREMHFAAASWGSVSDVRLVHMQSYDAICDSSHYPSEGKGFVVIPVHGRDWVAGWDDMTRRLMIDDLAFDPTQNPSLGGTIRHEVGHVLWFRHEHIRYPNTVYECSAGQPDEGPWYGVTAYDSASVMHYWWCPGWTGNLQRPLSYLDKFGAAGVYGQSPHNAATRLAGDFDGDGKSDAAVIYDWGNADMEVLVSYVRNGALAQPVSVYRSGVGNWNAVASQPLVGDFDGDGRADIAVLYDYGNLDAGLLVFRSTGTAFALPEAWWRSGSGNWDAGRSKPVVGDFDGDGKADVVMLYDYTNRDTGQLAFFSTGTSFAAPVVRWRSGAGNWSWSDTKIVAGEFDAAPGVDVAYLYDYGNMDTGILVSSGGLQYPVARWRSGQNNWSWPQSRIAGAGRLTSAANDDIVIAYAYAPEDMGLLVVSPWQSVVTPQSWWRKTGWSMWRSQFIMGDFSGDSMAEVVDLYEYLPAKLAWWRFSKSGSSFVETQDWASGTNEWDWTKAKAF